MQISDFSSYLNCASISEKGLVRRNNEDSVAILVNDGCFVVADGMGGYDCGEIASRIVVDTVTDLLIGSVSNSPGGRKYAVYKAISRAHTLINDYKVSNNITAMGSTLALLVFDPWDFSVASICHLGDSRVYCFRNDELFQLTRDHNVASSLKCNCGRDYSEKIGNGNLLTRSVGISQNIYPEWTDTSVCKDDIFIVCSDGLSSVINDENIKNTIALEQQPKQMVSSLKKKILAAGAPDNFSIICIKVLEVAAPAAVSQEELLESNFLLNRANRMF